MEGKKKWQKIFVKNVSDQRELEGHRMFTSSTKK